MRDNYDTIDRRDRDHHSRDRGSRSAFFEYRDEDRRESARRRDGDWDSPHRDRRRDAFGSRSEKYGPDAFSDGFPKDETDRLIASNKVEGTPVYGPDGERLGTIHNFMVDKYSGEVVYAVLKSSGGFLGLGERYYALDWCDLRYDRRAQGYGLDMTEHELDQRQSFDSRGRPIEDRGREPGRGRPYREEFERRSRW